MSVERHVGMVADADNELRSAEGVKTSSAIASIEKSIEIFRAALDDHDIQKKIDQEAFIDKQLGDYLDSVQAVEAVETRFNMLREYISFLMKAEIISPQQLGERHDCMADPYYQHCLKAIELLGDIQTSDSFSFLAEIDETLAERFDKNDTSGQDFISLKWDDDNNWDRPETCEVFDNLSTKIVEAVGKNKQDYALSWLSAKFFAPTKHYYDEEQLGDIFDSGSRIGSGGESYFEDLREWNLAYTHGDKMFEFTRLALLDALFACENSRQAIDDTMTWLQTDRLSFFFRKEVAAAFSRADAEYSKNTLLELVKDPPNPHVRELAVNLLFRLELGEVPITEDGLDYLNKKYNLGEYNQKGNVARRLTMDGTVGVFNKERTLAVCFDAARPDAPEEIVTPKLKKLSVSDLFFPRPNETEDERASRERALETFTNEYFKVYQSELFDRTGFYFSDLSLKEQGAFLLLHERLGGEGREYGKLMEFTRRRGESAFRSLLALQYEPEIFGAIVDISEKAPSEIVEKFFRKISEITQSADRVGDYLRDTYGQDEASAFKIAVITERLMQRAVGLIGEWGNDPQAIGTEEIKALDQVKADILLFAAAFKEVSRGKKIDLAEVAETSIETIEANNISKDDRAMMRDIFIGNRTHFPKELLQKDLLEDFEKPFEGKSKFYILRNGNDVIGYLRFEKMAVDKTYAGLFNISPELTGSAIGSALFRHAIEREGATRAIEALVYKNNPMLKHYIDDFGFRVTGEMPDFEGTGETVCKIERPSSQISEHEEFREAA